MNKNKKLRIVIICVVITLIIGTISYFLFFNKKIYTSDIRLVDSEQNPSRKIVVLKNNKEPQDIKEIKTIDGIVIDETYPFTINHTSVKKLNGKIIVVLKNGKEITVEIK